MPGPDHGTLGNPPQSGACQTPDAALRFAIRVVSEFSDRHSIIALNIRVGSSHSSQHLGSRTKLRASTTSCDAAQGIAFRAGFQIQFRCNTLTDDAHSTHRCLHRLVMVTKHLLWKTSSADVAVALPIQTTVMQWNASPALMFTMPVMLYVTENKLHVNIVLLNLALALLDRLGPR